jgi:hypothetical protein
LIDPSGQRVKNNQAAAPAIGGTVPGNPLLPAVAP